MAELLPIPPKGTKAELQAEVLALRADRALIEERLHAEANDREWCELYDEFVARLNGDLSVPIKPRARTASVWVSGDLILPFSERFDVDLPAGVALDSEEGKRAVLAAVEAARPADRFENTEYGLDAGAEYRITEVTE